MSLVVYIIFFVLLFLVLSKKAELRFSSFFLGLMIFPSCIWIVDSPKIEPFHIFLFTLFCVEFFFNFKDFKRNLKSFPFVIPILGVFFSFALTVYSNEGLDMGKCYTMIRNFTDIYGPLIIAYIVGKQLKEDSVLEQIYWPLLILGFLGIIEGLFQANYPFQVICSSFPYYNGFYSLNEPVQASIDTWRSRTLLTTCHPTSFGALLCALVFFYAPQAKARLSSVKNFFFYAVFLSNLYFCGCRTAMVLAAIAFIYMFVWRQNIYFKVAFAIAMAFVVIILGHYVIDYFSVEGQGSSLQLRQSQLLFSINAILDKPIFGNGVGYMNDFIFEKDAYGKTIMEEDIMGLESILFVKIIDYGLFGLCSFLLLSGWIFFWFYRRSKKYPEAESGLLITATTMGLFYLSGNIGNISALSYALIGLLAAEIKNKEELFENEETDEKKQEGEKP